MYFHDDDFVGGVEDRRRRPREIVCKCREVRFGGAGFGGAEDHDRDHDRDFDFVCKCRRCRRRREEAAERRHHHDDCCDY
ncbi:hypothetical protein ACA29_22870 [Lederbergia galactosidilytica]|uniref:Uncharacterized protein n=1 Tax=Lederbergia galactosidilytica TaxID=217031 RepID=A0A0Q9XQI9_9BACI|nr:hypothetical protein ACA29_22870 [Lederbergia galactosidilytica]